MPANEGQQKEGDHGPYYTVTVTISAGVDNEGHLGAAHDIVNLTDLLRDAWQFDVDYHDYTD